MSSGELFLCFGLRITQCLVVHLFETDNINKDLALKSYMLKFRSKIGACWSKYLQFKHHSS